MSDEQKTETTTFESLEAVLTRLEEVSAKAQEAITEYQSIVEQLTGHKAGAPIHALDVVKIVKKAFQL